MKKNILFLALCICAIITGCSKKDVFNEIETHEYSEELITTDGLTILGKRLENPYSLDNMRKALNNIIPNSRGVNDGETIQATHYYVKFIPKNQQDLDLMKRDSTICWYDFPLDYEIKQYGAYYHDPEIPDSLPTYQYASIDVDKWNAVSKIGVEYEVITELFIPDEYKDGKGSPIITTRSGEYINDDLIEYLVDEALRITHNNEDDMLVATTRASSKWRPAGKITYYDDTLGKTIGLEGIEVRARRWFTTHKGIVDVNGNYSCDGQFERPANYSFDLERYEFQVNGDGVKTNYDGPKKTGNWDYHFSRTSSQSEYFGATIFRAAYHYYYKNIDGLRRPPENSFWNTQMKLKAFNETNNDINGSFGSANRFLGLGNPIKIYNPGHTTDAIYATTIHELAHAAHWRMIVKEPDTNRYRDYHDAEDKMVESWACGVQWYLTKMVYTNYPGKSPILPNYTNVVIDLIDSKETEANYGKSYLQGDKVQDYTIVQIEQALIGCHTWNMWRDNIKTKYSNNTKQYVDELFALW